MASDTQLDMESADLERAVQYLREGGIVAIPTDTLYGLAVDVFNRSAIDRVFAVKGRPKDLALPVLVGDWNQVKRVAKNLSPQARTLADSFWPG
ncbi:MAG: Sua5/YciO/YrdC/YwlC family protein, partial [Chloroflexota bacterium]|nr:Sua5/YciO/YrdC/YwlC family protein [Chloroflexota bacterium]